MRTFVGLVAMTAMIAGVKHLLIDQWNTTPQTIEPHTSAPLVHIGRRRVDSTPGLQMSSPTLSISTTSATCDTSICTQKSTITSSLASLNVNNDGDSGGAYDLTSHCDTDQDNVNDATSTSVDKGKADKEIYKCQQNTFGHRPAPPQNIVTDLNGMAYPAACYDGRDGTTADPYYVFVLGDWGGLVDDVESRSDEKKNSMKNKNGLDNDVNIHPLLEFLRGPGVDQSPQQHVRDRMVQLASDRSPEYILNVGDSFYPGGIKQHCRARRSDVDNQQGGLFNSTPPRQFVEAYENFYKDDTGLNGKEWLGVLGNHDYGGVCYNMDWAAQIWYTWNRHPLSSQRWVMPAQYYSRRVEFIGASTNSSTTADMFFLDTNFYDTVTQHGHDICGINGNTYNVETAPPGEEEGWHCKGYLGNHAAHASNGVCEGTNFTSPEACASTFENLWKEQLIWLEDGLAASNADWQIIITHYPPYYGAIAEKIRPLAKKYGVDLIVSGHVHAQELYAPNSNVHGQNWGKTAIIVSGGGGGIVSEPSEPSPRPDGNDNRYGFMDLAITADTIIVRGHSWNAKGQTITVLAVAAALRDNMTSTSITREKQVDMMPSEFVRDANCVGTYDHVDDQYYMGYPIYKGGNRCIIYHSKNKALGWVLSDNEELDDDTTGESWVSSNGGDYKISNTATLWAMNPLKFGMEPSYEYTVFISEGSMNQMLFAEVNRVDRNVTEDEYEIASNDPCDESCYSRGASYTCRDRIERIAWDANKGGPTYAVFTVNTECVGQCECSMPVADYIVAKVPDFEVDRFVDQKFGPCDENDSLCKAMKNIPYFYVRWQGFDLLDHTSIEWSDDYPNGTISTTLMQDLYLEYKSLTVDEYRERVQLWTPKSARQYILSNII